MRQAPKPTLVPPHMVLKTWNLKGFRILCSFPPAGLAAAAVALPPPGLLPPPAGGMGAGTLAMAVAAGLSLPLIMSSHGKGMGSCVGKYSPCLLASL